jgi:biopolymer transport protein ExbD
MLRTRPRLKFESPVIGFQIAPMVDVVFVIMLFFMAVAWTQKEESRLSMRLPGCTLAEVVFPDELLMRIEDDGTVLLNDEPVAGATDRKMPQLAGLLSRLRELQASPSTIITTLEVEPDASYERMMDVLNALSKANITNVPLAVNGV